MSTGGAPLEFAAIRAWLTDLVADTREFLSLKEAERRASSLDEATVTAIARALAESDQRREAAEVLATHGATAESLRNAAEAFQLLVAVAGPDVLPARHDELVAACAKLPVLDDELEPHHSSLLRGLLAAQGELASRLWPLTLDSKGRAATRLERRTSTVSALVLITLLSVWWWHRTATTVTASATWGGKFPAENVIDGDESSHWVLPDHSLGWLEVRFRSPRAVRQVRILNGFEPATYGVVDFRLEGLVGSQIVKVTDGTFAGQGRYAKQPWLTVPFETGVRVDAIRIVVKSSRELGASLAEIEVQ